MDVPDGWPRPWPDDRCWVRLGPAWAPDRSTRFRIFGSAHVGRGRIHVCSIGNSDLHRTVSLCDVVETSPEAALWLDGFLRAQEASFYEFMGGTEEYGETADDERRWHDWNAAFVATGSAPPLRELPPASPALDGLGAPLPWTFVAGRFWVWSDGRWAPADPQPAEQVDPQSWLWPDSICAARGFHEKQGFADSLSVCTDCHEVDE